MLTAYFSSFLVLLDLECYFSCVVFTYFKKWIYVNVSKENILFAGTHSYVWGKV